MGKSVNKPIIGVSTALRGGFAPWIFIRLNVWLAGGQPIRLTPKRKNPVDRLDGLILSGGADIAPDFFGEESLVPQKTGENGYRQWRQHPLRLAISTGIYLLRLVFGIKRSPSRAPDRDHLESALMNGAVQRRIPILGICRGMQFINIYFGGDLHQHLSDFYGQTTHPHTVLPYKRVGLVGGSKLHKILGVTTFKVNALHHQAVKKLGKGITVSANDSLGIIQALEHKDFPFIIGVQWHPEFLPHFPGHRKLFRAFIQASKNSQAGEAE